MLVRPKLRSGTRLARSQCVRSSMPCSETNSATGCPSRATPSTGCGALCYTACPSENELAEEWAGTEIFYDRYYGESTLMVCCAPPDVRFPSLSDEMAAFKGIDRPSRCSYYMQTGGINTVCAQRPSSYDTKLLMQSDYVDEGCPDYASLRPSYCLLAP
jgi:hypothetical protein